MEQQQRPTHHAVLLYCCKVSGKTSLLFQFAVNRAAESGRGAVFICNKGRLESNPPFLSQGVDPSTTLLQRIQIKYIEDGDEIRKYFAAFHLLDNFPAAVIVDDFGDFFSERSCQQRYGTSRARDVAMIRALALCHNAIAHANAKLGTLGSCNLLLSDVQQADGTGSYILKTIGSSESETKKARKAKYSVALQYLVLEEMST
nr:unnamed protein product [Digitaria exilis]CAB3504687.1 unnamed protein product [Digitaria exilis]